MKNYAIVGFIYNQPCPLKCNFCCHTREVVGPERFSPEKLPSLIAAFGFLPQVIRFAFSGGDPFLYIDEIIDVMTKARALKVKQPFHVVTSGFWAKDPRYADSIIKELVSIGM